MATQQQLLLVEDVEDLGKSGDIVKVKPGFARNFLIPNGFAVVADKRAVRMQERLQEERKKKTAEDRSESEELAKRFETITLEIVVKVDEEGHMYGSVSSVDLMKKLEEEHQIVLLKKGIQLKHPIKETGVHTIDVNLKEGVTAQFTLKVIPETENAEEASTEEA